MQYWLLKTEPDTYSWSDLVNDKRTVWSGVRNFQARNHIRAMKKGDLALIYHSGGEKAVQGIAKITKGPYADPTAKDGDWSAVDIAPVKALTHAVTLAEIKRRPILKDMVLVKNSRLSVQPVTEKEWKETIRKP